MSFHPLEPESNSDTPKHTNSRYAAVVTDGGKSRVLDTHGHVWGTRRKRAHLRASAVYFIKARGRNLVKIGYTGEWQSVQSRLNTLQTASPYDLEIITIVRGVERDFEQEMHGMFCASRLRGEWFEYTTEMQEFLRSLDDACCESNGTPREDIAHFITQEEFNHAAPVL